MVVRPGAGVDGADRVEIVWGANAPKNTWLVVTVKGNDLRGEETLTCTTGLNKVHTAAVRFHLHPKVSVSLVKDGEEALITLPGGTGWRFTASGAPLTLEESIYLGDGIRPRKSKQLVITAKMDIDTLQIKWAMQRELL